MTTAQDVINYAAKFIGYKEGANNNNKFGVWYGMNNAAWCAMFVSYCFYNSGLSLPAKTSKGFAYCGDGVNYFKNKGWWHTSNPKVGDVVFYNWSNTTEKFDHVGIVEKVNANGSIGTIEGNESNQVMRKTRSSSIIGYGRPPYSQTSNGRAGVYPSWPGRYIALTTPFMQGTDVLLWQRQMIHRGWKLAADSTFDESDHDALIKFQKEKELEVDGKIGPMSWNAAWESPIT